ncbi:MAG: hypothetical protein KC431_00975, partial [Myxococcales bacterium]|nr:hypothetical protein [Myxococcales bacterium]
GCAADCMALGPFCGDGMVNGPETCDDQNADSNDGCLGSCVVPSSCLEILEYDDQAESGAYQIGPKGPDATFEVECDMELDGGGWTGFMVESTCNGDLDSAVTAVEPAPIEGVDMNCRPFTRDAASFHTYYWDIEFPPGYQEFYLADYVMKANAGNNNTSDIQLSFAQSVWDIAHMGAGIGDVSFGSADDMGPTTSYSATLPANMSCFDCETPFPENMTPYQVGVMSTAFRIGWGEAGGEAEGWYPWWSGRVFLR